MKNAPNFRWLVVHLAIADAIYAVVTPMQFLYLLHNNNEWRLGTGLCKTITFIGPLTVNVSALILCLMGYERYRAICRPFSRRFSLTVINLIVFVIWVVCIALKIDILLHYHVVNSRCTLASTSKIPYLINSLVSLLADSLIPIVLLTYYLIRVNITLRLRARYLNNMNSTKLCRKFENDSNIISDRRIELNIEESGKVKQSRFSLGYETDTNFNTRFKLKRASMACKDRSNSDGLTCNNYPWTPVNKCNLSQIEIFGSLSSTGRKQGSIFTLISAISRKRTSLHELAKIRIKNSRDRSIVKVFLLTVIIFFVSSIPYNVFYFVVILLYTTYFTNVDIEKYSSSLESANSWLGLLVLSGCIMNVFIYSGKFPEFRQQMNIMLNLNHFNKASFVNDSRNV
ncbi:nematocin receptor 2 isoform X3 [Hydra vulgaris]|uniref:Nematocin receptor 2 isoform X3 n=1 Tax=Hydra vulgaris TaxID=6087 RepID=A0ABM4DBS9_HYDVU